MSVNPVVPLEFLGSGEEGRVSNVEGCHEIVVRLAEMGIQQGVDVRMVQPGNPCIIALNNHRISYRGDAAAIVMVEVLNSPPRLPVDSLR